MAPQAAEHDEEALEADDLAHEEEVVEEEAQADEPEKGEDTRMAEGGEAGEDEEGEEQVGDKPRERPKKTSKQRREERKASERRVRDERDFLLQQNAEILQKLAQLEDQTLGSRLLTVDSRLSECLNDASTAERLELEALAAKDNQGVIDARRIREKAASQAGLFKTEKERLTHALAQAQKRPPTQVPVPGASDVAKLAAQFRADKPWIQIDEKGMARNAESAVALSVDETLRRSGLFDERDPKYWNELERRLKGALPEMFRTASDADHDDDEDDEDFLDATPNTPAKQPVKAAATPAARKGPAVGSSARQSASGTGKRLSAERVAALKDIGAWDDPKQRAEFIKEYEKYDREHGSN